MAEALSLVAGKGLRAGSQVEYEELSENIKTSKSMDLLEEKRWELVNLSKGLKIKEDRMCYLLLRAIEAKEASESEED